VAITAQTVRFDEAALSSVQRLLGELGLDGWLLYDFHGNNPVAAGVLGLPPLTRRYFALIPATGRPTALIHRIELQPWAGWIGDTRVYLGWRSLESELMAMFDGAGTLALEWSPGDAVPYVDRVPAGVLDLIRSSGIRVESSGDLVSAFHSRWSAEGEASHRRAAQVLRDTAFAAFDLIGERLRAGETPGEWEMRRWVTDRLTANGLSIGADAIVAVDANAANPHYAPGPDGYSVIRPGNVILLDLWGKESADSVYADQTWMAYAGSSVPERIDNLWSAVREARDTAVRFVESRWSEAAPVAGYEVDDAARAVLAARGLGDAFIHRTGHSIDRELHGSGPNIDNLETRDTRSLIPGIGFSIEPGVYLEGDVGLRSEVDVFMGPDGPEVTTPGPQRAIHRIELE
jgi:Xaa-Pro dipeptidase